MFKISLIIISIILLVIFLFMYCAIILSSKADLK